MIFQRFTSRLIPLLLSAAVIMAAAACATQSPDEEAATGAEPEHVDTVEGLHEYQLENGMRVVLFPDSSRSSVFINTTYFVGARHEGYGETGMAHLLEHMLFYGTPDHPDVRGEISERGGRANASVTHDRTNYFQSLPADPENLEWAIGMEADRMRNADFDEEDLASEMTVVRNEFEIAQDNPLRALMDHVGASAYRWHGYGRTVLGAESDIENVPMERLRGFYDRYYQPDNAMVVVSGRFDEEAVLEKLNAEFGAVPAPDRSEKPIWDTYTREPTQHGPREVTVHRSGDNPMVAAAFHVPATNHEDYPAVDLLAHVLGTDSTGRLHKALVETGIASNVGAFSRSQREPGTIFLWARLPEDGDLEKAERVLLETIEEVREEGVDEEETQRARNSRLRNVERGLSDSERVGRQLTEWAASGDWRLLFIHRDRLEETQTEDLDGVAADYLQRDNRTVGRFLPEDAPQRAEIPEGKDIAQLIDEHEFREEGLAAAEEFDPTPENIHTRLSHHELANGMRVHILPRETRGESIHGLLVFRLGDEESLDGLAQVGNMTAHMLPRGTEQSSRSEISDRIDELQATLNVHGSATRGIARFETDAERLDSLLDLTVEIFREPSFDEDEFAEYQRAQIAQLQQGRNQPQVRASNRLGQVLGHPDPDHPEHTPDLDQLIEQFSEIEAEDLADFHEAFYGAQDASLILVGPVESEEVLTALEEGFGDWTAASPYQRIASIDHELDPETHEIETPDQSNAMLVGAQRLSVGVNHEDYPALTLGNYMLGGGFLSSRLQERIRNEEGISYGVGSGLDADEHEDTGVFQVMAMFNPANRGRLEQAMQEELERVVEEGYTEEELEAARDGLLNEREVSRSNEGELISQLNTLLATDREVLWEAEFEDRLRELEVDEVNQAMARHLDPDALVWVIAGDLLAAPEEEE